jgi:hypothetical protein
LEGQNYRNGEQFTRAKEGVGQEAGGWDYKLAARGILVAMEMFCTLIGSKPTS